MTAPVIMRTPFDLDVIEKNIGRSPTMIRAMSERADRRREWAR